MSLTYDELKGQYTAMARTVEAVDAHLPKIAALISGCDKTVFVGCGSSYAVARSGALMAGLRLNKPSIAIAAGDLLLHADAYRPALEGCALVALSRSGETTEVIRALQRIQAMGVSMKVLGVASTEGSTLAAYSDAMLEMPWSFDHSVCQTRTVSCLYLFCAYAVARLAGDEALSAQLRAAVNEGSAFLSANESALARAAQGDWSHAVVLGDAELGGLCEEGALAFKEICQVPSNHYPLLDVRHGPMVLIGKDTLVIAVLSGARGTPELQLETDLLRDAVKKGATVVAYSDEPLHMPGVLSVSFGAPLAHPARGIPAIAVCQLISYYKSRVTGANPDQPDGLSPWIALA